MQIEQRSVKKLNAEIPRERDSRLWWNCVGGLFIGMLVVGGIAVGAQARLAAHETGAENVELERKLDKLKAERDRLLLERNNSLAPEELKKRAKKIGMQEITAEQLNPLGIKMIEQTPPKTKKSDERSKNGA